MCVCVCVCVCVRILNIKMNKWEEGLFNHFVV